MKISPVEAIGSPKHGNPGSAFVELGRCGMPCQVLQWPGSVPIGQILQLWGHILFLSTID